MRRVLPVLALAVSAVLAAAGAVEGAVVYTNVSQIQVKWTAQSQSTGAVTWTMTKVYEYYANVNNGEPVNIQAQGTLASGLSQPSASSSTTDVYVTSDTTNTYINLLVGQNTSQWVLYTTSAPLSDVSINGYNVPKQLPVESIKESLEDVTTSTTYQVTDAYLVQGDEYQYTVSVTFNLAELQNLINDGGFTVEVAVPESLFNTTGITINSVTVTTSTGSSYTISTSSSTDTIPVYDAQGNETTVTCYVQDLTTDITSASTTTSTTYTVTITIDFTPGTTYTASTFTLPTVFIVAKKSATPASVPFTTVAGPANSWNQYVKADDLIEIRWQAVPQESPSTNWKDTTWLLVPIIYNKSQLNVTVGTVTVEYLSAGDPLTDPTNLTWSTAQTVSGSTAQWTSVQIPAGASWTPPELVVIPPSSSGVTYWRIIAQDVTVQLPITDDEYETLVIDGFTVPVVPSTGAGVAVWATATPYILTSSSQTVTFIYKAEIVNPGTATQAVFSLSLPGTPPTGFQATVLWYHKTTTGYVVKDITSSVTESVDSTNDTLTVTVPFDLNGDGTADITAGDYIVVEYQFTVSGSTQVTGSLTLEDSSGNTVLTVNFPTLTLTQLPATSNYPVITGRKFSTGFEVQLNGYTDPNTGDFGMPLVVMDFILQDYVPSSESPVQFLSDLTIQGTWGGTQIASATVASTDSTSNVVVWELKDANGNVLGYLTFKWVGAVTVGTLNCYAVLVYSSDSSGNPVNAKPNTDITVTYNDLNATSYVNLNSLVIAVDPSFVETTGQPLVIKLPTKPTTNLQPANNNTSTSSSTSSSSTTSNTSTPTSTSHSGPVFLPVILAALAGLARGRRR